VRLDDFWALIQDSAAAREQRERTEWLTRSLAGLPVRAIIEDGLDNALEAQGLHRISDSAPEGDPWNYDAPDQRLARLPRLTALLG
jgi:hypothetical protein